MALRDWIRGSGGSAAAVPAVIAVQEPKNERKTAKTATTATAKAEKVAADLEAPKAHFTDATIYEGEPTPEAIDIADEALKYIAAQRGPVAENEIISALGGDPIMARDILHRLAVDGIAEAMPGGRFGIPGYPRPPADLPSGCPLTGAPFPETGCAFDERMLRRLLQTGALPLPGGRCPIRRLCEVK